MNLKGSQALFAHGWFLELTPSAPQMWEHCRWWLNQMTDSVSLSFPLWTCIVADESTNSNVSFLFPHSPRTLSVLTFHIHVTVSPLVFLLTPLVLRIVSFDYPPVVVQHTVSSYTSKRYHLSKPGQITAMPHHQQSKNDLTTI